MSHFRCPLCGKQSTIKNYHPEIFENSVEIVYNRGLGRGRGFESIYGYDLNDFPGLKVKMQKRAKEITRFLGNRENAKQNYQNLYYREKQKRLELQEYIEELDLEYFIALLNRNNKIESTNIGAAITFAVQKIKALENEIDGSVESLNLLLPDYYEYCETLEESVDEIGEYLADMKEELTDYSDSRRL